DLTFDEVKTAASLIHSVVAYSANIIFGACIDPNISDEVEVTVIATGFSSAERGIGGEEAAQPSAQDFRAIRDAVRKQSPAPTLYDTPSNEETAFRAAPQNAYREPTPAVPQPERSEETEEREEGKPDGRLPSFVQKLLGKKKN
ncbi:MAG: hypothetical protein ACI4NG_02035, partial [Candidatus Gallimonas sp.]